MAAWALVNNIITIIIQLIDLRSRIVMVIIKATINQLVYPLMALVNNHTTVRLFIKDKLCTLNLRVCVCTVKENPCVNLIMSRMWLNYPQDGILLLIM